MQWNSSIEEIFIVAILAPFIETLFLQTVPYQLVSYASNQLSLKVKTHHFIYIFLSSVLFAAMHTYNWLYCLGAFIGGLTLNYSYVYFKKQKFYPYLSVVSIHLLYNLAVLVLKTGF